MGSVRVLVVDDESGPRSVMDAVLREEGFDTFAAADGNAALERLGRERFDLLITDVRMPAMDGIELARRAREMRPGIPVLFVSAYDPRFPFAEFDDFIRKPFRPRELVGCVYALLRRRGR